jgi:hypothetical protein
VFKKGRDAWDAAASRYGAPASRSHNAEGEALPQFLGRNLDANNLLNRAKLQGLGGHSLLVVADAATKRNRGGRDRGDDDNALQTLHGLLSFG